jgi:2-dehydropantoate 2-reductase
VRFVVYGAGAVGGMLGGALHEAGHEVVLIARGAHLAAIQADGLRMVTPDGAVTAAVPAVGHPAEIEFRSGDVVLVAVKSQDSEPALQALAAVAPSGVAVVSVQNGVANEPAALRWFADVYGVCVQCPAVHLEPGVVEVRWSPVMGILDIGRYPHGIDARGEAIAASVGSTAFESVARPDIMRWKYGKLRANLNNAVDALCGPGTRTSVGTLVADAEAEADACFEAAGIPFASLEEATARRALVSIPPWDAPISRLGASSWQSLARGTGSIEVDYLNGEIVKLGREHGILTPVNEALQRIANRAAREGWAAGSVVPEDLIHMVRDGE